MPSLQLSCVGGQGGGRAEAICASTKEMNNRNQTERAGQGSWTTSRADKRQPRASRLTEPACRPGACPAREWTGHHLPRQPAHRRATPRLRMWEPGTCTGQQGWASTPFLEPEGRPGAQLGPLVGRPGRPRPGPGRTGLSLTPGPTAGPPTRGPAPTPCPPLLQPSHRPRPRLPGPQLPGRGVTQAPTWVQSTTRTLCSSRCTIADPFGRD